MVSLEKRLDLLYKLGAYMLSEDEHWVEVQERAVYSNAWFTKEGVEQAVKSIANEFLKPEKLQAWITAYKPVTEPKKVGIVMAGNIPLVGFHDFIAGFAAGQMLLIKPSSKDDILLKHLIAKLVEWEPEVNKQVQVSDILKGCDAYIATGSNNTARYFQQYFGKYPNIIRKNRTSVAVLDGTETEAELDKLAVDIFTYFGLGCRNVTQVCVPVGYDFQPLMDVLSKHDVMMMHHKYKNNYDYHLAVYLLNAVPYMTNDSILLVENEIPFSSVSVLHYRYYTDKAAMLETLRKSDEIQCIVSKETIPFGDAQKPTLNDYPDGVDTMAFMCSL
jgi:hypothetical protein